MIKNYFALKVDKNKGAYQTRSYLFYSTESFGIFNDMEPYDTGVSRVILFSMILH